MKAEPVRRMAREKLGITTAGALATALDVDPANMSRYLRGHCQPPSNVIAGLLDLLDEPFEALFEIRPDQAPTRLTSAA